MKGWCVCFLAVLSSLAWADEKPKVDIDAIFAKLDLETDQRNCFYGHLTRPYFPGAADEQTFDYYYRLVRPAAPGHTTVVYLTGGPGQSAMNMAEKLAARYPAELGLLVLDPRGIGCNRPRKVKVFPTDFYSTRHVAEDTLAAVRDLKLTHYTLAGGSYGSMVASVAASLAEQERMPSPDAVVLHGVVGHDLRGEGLLAGFQKEWAAELALLPDDVREAIESDRLIGDGLSAEDWGAVVTQQVLFRFFPSDDERALAYGPRAPFLALSKGNAETGKKVRDWARMTADGAKPESDSVLAMYRAIACREISTGSWNTNSDVRVKLVKGKLEPIPTRTCDGLALDRPYEIRDWPSHAPTYYFVGGHDPSTPPDQGEYHFAWHTEAERFYVEVPDGGHSVLSSSLLDCHARIWSAIDAGGRALPEALKGCRFSTRLRHALAK